MSKKITKHLGYYISLFTIFSVGFILTILSTPNIKLQAAIIFLTIASYVSWGIIHHYITHELTPKIVMEYILVGLLGMSLLFYVFAAGAI